MNKLISRQVAIVDAGAGYVLVTPHSANGSKPWTSVRLERVVAFEIVCEEHESPAGERYLSRNVAPIGVSGNIPILGTFLALRVDAWRIELPDNGRLFENEDEILEALNDGGKEEGTRTQSKGNDNG